MAISTYTSTLVKQSNEKLNNTATEIIFIEDNVADYQSLVDGTAPGVEVVLLDSRGDGLVQMADFLADRQNIDSIHLISHGAEGQLNLGSNTLSSDTLVDNASLLSKIKHALSDDGDLLLYGCEVGEEDHFIRQLALLTDADVAASTDKTGGTQLGGNWVLENQIGHIESTLPITKTALFTFNSLLLIEGDTEDNNLEGTEGSDRIFGRGGNDTIKGLGGNDYLYGHPGDDSIEGGMAMILLMEVLAMILFMEMMAMTHSTLA
ncbi:DUF4347 domain-containing protein [Marinomonas sp. 15G1-11]|uniref:DUF4347 domain-containing protein n=1 Tax=Marinomonas phaeophyticola TaxID=3004091 RepID=A0ABT4JRI4_9GAMM|nr:DUF4347 domain-containing protein [Marinomonas sp. 15G1-11]MCZ2720967.1 DUF4347 domain-containing protein [Marinomonas sp. 15G1-11]